MTDTAGFELGPEDLDQLRRRGIPEQEALRQIALLRRPRRYARLDRPCRPGDGLETIPREAEGRLAGLAEAAASAGRLLNFVPASGAATRMFHDLIGALAATGAGSVETEVSAFLDALPRFAFEPELRETLERRGAALDDLRRTGRWRPILETLLETGGLAYASLPKALLKFHDYEGGARTALEEHLVEAASLARDSAGVCRVRFSVSPGQRAAFEELTRWVVPLWEGRLSCRFDVGFSVQSPATDTLALDESGRPFRDGSGSLVLRPAGHGALLDNLAALGADLVLIKNVDNVAPDRLKGPTYRWSRLLAGRALEIQARIAGLMRRLEDPADAAAAREGLEMAAATLGRRPPSGAGSDRRALARDLLDRPLRVCGMVPNAGEPGGGPFWTEAPDGRRELQIVEGAEVDPRDPRQREILAGASHFNPVFMACLLRDHRDRPYDLGAFADHDAVIVTAKSSGGRRLLALERPGLWNGAMARWNTVFVEVPPEVFNPVKSVADFLRPEHQPA